MGKLFILGMSPLPFENDKKVYGTGIRTWQFVQPLLQDGHQVCLVSYAIPSAYNQDFSSSHREGFKYGAYSFDYHLLSPHDFEHRELVSGLCQKFNPDCIIGCSFYPSYIASRIKSTQPMWADLFGHVMAEAQARAAVDQNDGCLFHYWNREYHILQQADMFSCVSGRQEYALIGELGAAGRLNRHTLGYDFSCSIPCGMAAENYEHTKTVIRNTGRVSEDDFVVLWTGGYNTWTDVDTLFEGLQQAMASNRSIKFVSTGGEIPEQDIKTYPHFLSLIEKSKFKDNFIMKGWVKGEDVPNYYLEADIGINIDKDIYEVRLGSKNRILDWMRAGLCVVSSDVCELTHIIKQEKIGYTFSPHDSQDLAQLLIYLASHRSQVKERGQKGRQYGLDNFSYGLTAKSLRQWVDSPAHAPDSGHRKEMMFLKEEALANLEDITYRQKKMIEERDRRLGELEAIVKRGFVYRSYAYLKKLKGKIGR